MVSPSSVPRMVIVSPKCAGPSPAVKAVHDAVGVVIERQLRAGHDPGALRRFIEGFVGVAGAGHKHPDHAPGFGRIVVC